MTHQEIETLLVCEAARRRQEALQHIAPLGGVDMARLSRWQRRAAIRRYIVAACLVVSVGLVSCKTVAYAARQPFTFTVAQGTVDGPYNYIVSQGNPMVAYGTLQTIFHLT